MEDWDAPSPAALRASYTSTVNAIKQFYKAFRMQYISSLKVQRRVCKSGTPYQPTIGDLVLISTEKHRHTWPLARVVETFPSEDGLIRTVKLFDGAQHLLRDPRQLLPLECDDPEAAIEPQLRDPTEPVPAEDSPSTRTPAPDVRPQQAAAARQRARLQELLPDLQDETF